MVVEKINFEFWYAILDQVVLVVLQVLLLQNVQSECTGIENPNHKCRKCKYNFPYLDNKINQLDGNITDITDDSDDSSTSTLYDSEDEAFSDPIPANLSPDPDQILSQGQPIRLHVNRNLNQ